MYIYILAFLSREERYEFIRSKYVEKKFAIRTCSDETDLINDLEHAVTSKHLFQLLQAFVEGADLTSVLPNSVSFEIVHTLPTIVK